MIQIPTPSASPAQLQTNLTVAAGWIALGFLAAFGAAILWKVFTGQIDLTRLISEPNGDASMSRFQLLVFTFVIAASLFLIIASPWPPAFPEQVPNGILILLGISASSYLVSKGIQFSAPEDEVSRGPEIKIVSPTTTATAGQPPIPLRAEVTGLTDTRVSWAIVSGSGAIDQSGSYTPPGTPTDGAKPTGPVVIKATSIENAAVTDTEVITLV